MTAHDAQPEPARCPFTGQAAPTETITRRHVPPQGDLAQPVETYARARDLLKSEQAQQAGFLADMVSRVPGSQHPPVLYLEGEEHTEMRRATAKYFTPTQVNTYQPDIARLADELIGKLARRGEAKLDDLSLELAVRVAAGVVGPPAGDGPAHRALHSLGSRRRAGSETGGGLAARKRAPGGEHGAVLRAGRETGD